jgi:hypothetical protein
MRRRRVRGATPIAPRTYFEGTAIGGLSVNSLTVEILLQTGDYRHGRHPAVLQPNRRSGTFASGKSRAGRDHPGARSTEYRTGKDF